MYDIAILGGGPGGYDTALYAAKKGLKVALIEKDEVGGVCLNRGCIPTKAIRASAGAAGIIRDAARYGISLSGKPSISYKDIVARKNKVVETNRKGIEQQLKKAGVDVVKGFGRISGESELTIEDTGQKIEAENIIVATGTHPASVGNIIIDHKDVISSDDILDMEELPESLTILGGGVMGCEFASIMHELGVTVTIVEAEPRLLPNEEEDTSAILTREMKKKKINIITGALITGIEKGGCDLNITLNNGKVFCSHKVLVTVGRKKNTAGIGLEELGIKTTRGGSIVVDENLKTDIPSIFAVGDVTGKMMVAHVASAQGRQVIDYIKGENWKIDYSAVPMGIFTFPEIGSVGMTEKYAKELDIPYEIKTILYRMLGKAHAEGEIAGQFKLIVNKETKQLLGTHIVGEHAADMIMEAALMMHKKISVDDIKTLVHPHPTYIEGFSLALLE